MDPAVERLAGRLHELEIALTASTARVAALVEAVERQNELSADRLERHERAIYGNGVPGLKHDVEVLKTESESRRWTNRSAAVALIGLVAKAIWELLTGGR